MSHLTPFLLCLAGFAALALAMERPQHDLLGRRLPRPATRTLRAAGAGALLLALGVLVAGQGWGLGAVQFSGHTSVAAAVVHGVLIACTRRRSHPTRQR